MSAPEPIHPQLLDVGIDEDSGDLSRADVILKGALAAGALYGLSAIGPYVQKTLALVGENDVATLNFLLAFEYLQVDFYDRSKSELSEMKPTDELKGLLEILRDEEHQHVDALTASIKELGGKPKPKTDYAFAYSTVKTFLGLADSLENSAIGAYNGAMPTIQSQEVLETVGSIVQVEGRHAAAIQLERKEEPPAPEAFDPGLKPLQALNSVVKFTGPEIFKAAG